MKKKCKVVALPTKDKKNGIILNTPNGVYGNDLFHLYVVSDEEIKEGDYIYDGKYGFSFIDHEVYQWSYDNWIESPDFEDMKAYKIIATTNEQLELPLIPELFVKEYCDANGIEEVMVDFIKPKCECVTGYCICSDNPQIEISYLKESWSREEVEVLCRKTYNVAWDNGIESLYHQKELDVFNYQDLEDEFINNNL